MRIRFDRGTILLEGVEDPALVRDLPGVLWDERVGRWRAPAYLYASLRRELAGRGVVDLDDRVRPGLAAAASSRDADPATRHSTELRPYQAAALGAWELAERRGLVVLPTGSGKTRVGVAAIARAGSALCLAPTRVLLGHWSSALEQAGLGPVGRVGDGERSIERITVSTYESAWRNMHRWGSRFPFLVVDEVHHFGGGLRDEALEMSVAPSRLGLTATPPDEPAAERLEQLVGRCVFRLGIEDLRGRHLADFEVVRITVDLTPAERARYEELMGRFRAVRWAFARIGPEGRWSDFVRFAGQSPEGRRALWSFHAARRLVAYPCAKQRVLATLLERRRDDRILVFTADNNTAYAVSREHLIACITCEIRRAERDDALTAFRERRLGALVSAKVLNEGIDVPDADVAIIVGASGGAREHVQRIGRVLRPAPGKRAVVYELVARGTTEERRARERGRALAAG